jgi:glycosyltransferase involved in cell wall biosynthesis
MRIIYFSLDYTPHDQRFLAALSASEHQVYYVRLQRGSRQTEDRPVPENIEMVQWAGGKKPFEWRDLPRLVFDFWRLIRQLKPDLIHAGPIQTCAFIAVLSGFRPILTMSWGFDLMKDVRRSKWWEFATRFTLKRSTFFTSDANITREMAVKYGMNPDKTVVFPWGVDLEHFTPKKWEISQPERGLTLFCNRSWEANYGVDVLAKAFVTVARQREDVSLMLLGGGSQGPLLRQIFASAGLLDRVTFPGHMPNRELPRFYHMADLYISPSHVDGSSVSLMEALACGLPCLVSDIPANKEWVQDGYNGWLFADGDALALAAKISAVIETRATLPQIGQNARMCAEEKANWPKNVQILLKTYQRTLEQCQKDC